MVEYYFLRADDRRDEHFILLRDPACSAGGGCDGRIHRTIDTCPACVPESTGLSLGVSGGGGDPDDRAVEFRGRGLARRDAGGFCRGGMGILYHCHRTACGNDEEYGCADLRIVGGGRSFPSVQYNQRRFVLSERETVVDRAWCCRIFQYSPALF